MPLVTPMPKVVLAMVTHGLNWDGANRSLTKGVAARSTADIVAGLRQHVDRSGDGDRGEGRGKSVAGGEFVGGIAVGIEEAAEKIRNLLRGQS